MGDDGSKYTTDKQKTSNHNNSTGGRDAGGGQSTGPETAPEADNIPTGQVVVSFLTYAFLVFVRVSGLSSLFHSANPRNFLAAPPLSDIGQFVFYDAILLAVVGLASSGLMLALALDESEPENERLVAVTSLGMGLPGLVLIVGSVFVAIF